MDNRQIVCQGHSESELHHALAFAMADHESGGAVGFRIDGPWLVLYWRVPTSAPKGYSAFVSAMNAERLAPVVWNWLVSIPAEDRPDCPDFDGSRGDGFRLETDRWGRATTGPGDLDLSGCYTGGGEPIPDFRQRPGEHGTFARVRFEWAWYGK